MTALRHYSQGAPAALLVLPGAQMHPHDVEQAGLPGLVQRSGAALDLVVADLHLDPTGQRDAARCLAEDLLPPLIKAYRRPWLAGISLGGLLALLHALRQPAPLQGLCLLAPYPGSRLTTNTIARAGGLHAWQPGPAQLADPEYELWSRLRRAPVALPTFIGWGQSDRFASSMDALAQALQPAARTVVAGGHGWDAWLPLWEQALAWITTSEPGGD